MSVVSLLIVPQPLCAVVVAANIVSITLGVMGLMAWWDVNLDAASMITITMSVGFSVDFSLHTTYAFMTQYTFEHCSRKYDFWLISCSMFVFIPTDAYFLLQFLRYFSILSFRVIVCNSVFLTN